MNSVIQPFFFIRQYKHQTEIVQLNKFDAMIFEIK